VCVCVLAFVRRRVKNTITNSRAAWRWIARASVYGIGTRPKYKSPCRIGRQQCLYLCVMSLWLYLYNSSRMYIIIIIILLSSLSLLRRRRSCVTTLGRASLPSCIIVAVFAVNNIRNVNCRRNALVFDEKSAFSDEIK